jgi:hypothetical protein
MSSMKEIPLQINSKKFSENLIQNLLLLKSPLQKQHLLLLITFRETT